MPRKIWHLYASLVFFSDFLRKDRKVSETHYLLVSGLSGLSGLGGLSGLCHGSSLDFFICSCLEGVSRSRAVRRIGPRSQRPCGPG